MFRRQRGRPKRPVVRRGGQDGRRFQVSHQLGEIALHPGVGEGRRADRPTDAWVLCDDCFRDARLELRARHNRARGPHRVPVDDQVPQVNFLEKVSEHTRVRVNLPRIPNGLQNILPVRVGRQRIFILFRRDDEREQDYESVRDI